MDARDRLLIESLQRFHHFFTSDLDHDDYKVECPTGSGRKMNLWDVSQELSRRLISIFQRDSIKGRPVYETSKTFQQDENWRDLVLFYEYFHGDTGKGLGASHQTGWTGLVTRCLEKIIWARKD